MRFFLPLLPIAIFFISACSSRPEYYREQKDGNIYWNPARPLTLSFPSALNTNEWSAAVRTVSNDIELNISRVQFSPSNTILTLALPPEHLLSDGTHTLKIAGSNGRNVLTNNILIIDTVAPVCRIISFSPVIKKGGSAMVLIEANDRYLKQPAVLVKEEGRFFTQPYKKEGYYIGFFVWPVTLGKFSASVIAQDKAGNAITNPIPVSAKSVRYPVSYIPIDHEFRNDKLEEVGESPTNRNLTEEERYQLIMKGFRGKKDVNIVDLTVKKIIERDGHPGFLPFDPLPNAKLTSPYGEHRYFVMKNRTMRNSYHLGLDMARSTNAGILVSNEGIVVYSGYNGANGNMIVVYHGFGIYTLYAHCSRLLARPYERVRAGQKIAISGKTGYALGDHLHFSVIIQGRYANPMEWMDRNWISENVTSVFNNAAGIINSGR